MEDLLIVPLLAIVAWMGASGDPQAASQRWQGIGVGLACIVGLLVAGRWLLNPLLRILAASKAREVMTAAALLVVLGAALLMQVGGLSMAMGAFLAGVLLSDPRSGIRSKRISNRFAASCRGCSFWVSAWSLDLRAVAADWRLIVAGVLVLMVGKGACIYAVARLMRSDHRQALDRGVLMAQGGEFAFVLFAAASASGVIDAQVTASLTAIVVLSMALTPLFVLLQRRLTPAAAVSLDGVEEASGQTGSVLIIGFGRFGQVASQSLLARDVDVTIIDNDIGMMQSAEELGFNIYHGDGILHASGAHSARAIAVCVDNQESANRIVELATREFPHAKLLARFYDRQHSLQLVTAGVHYQIRETFESAVIFGRVALE
ncbi:hypothetical protein ADT25_14430 [Xanthomonas oryzae]|uniref:RCK N-terminal domain-containing protein n=1 Tax=Xanthomonas oryzae TaxID=347 RepID=A0AAP0ZKQ1_9XANT|nr:hypothetical protein ADT25_14430 [Xanthomonas oryzae]